MPSKYDEIKEEEYERDVTSLLTRNPEVFENLVRTEFKEDMKILDIGCGIGLAAEKILKIVPNSRITLVDKSENMVKIARKRLKKHWTKCEFRTGSFLEMKKLEDYDAALLLSVGQDVLDSEKLIKKAFDCLKPGGLLLFFNIYTRGWGIFTTISNAVLYSSTGHVEHKPRRLSAWKKIIEKHGKIIDVKRVKLYQTSGHNLPHVLVLARKE